MISSSPRDGDLFDDPCHNLGLCFRDFRPQRVCSMELAGPKFWESVRVHRAIGEG